MNADVKGALTQIDTSWCSFEHNGKPMTKNEVKSILTWANTQGIKTVDEIPIKKIEQMLTSLRK